MEHTTNSWKRLVFYGEVVGFALAWIVGVVVLTRSSTPEPQLAGVEGIAHAEVGLNDHSPDLLK